MDSVHGLCTIDQSLRRILDTQELQRLRWIHQTGLNFLVYPGSEHSRFTHALGTYTVARRIFQHLASLAAEFSDLSPSKLDEQLEKAFLIAALCHDLGHTAFSHTLETILLPKDFRTHEDCTAHLLGTDTAIAKEIRGCGCDIEQVVQLLKGVHWVDGLCKLLSGNADVDRWDYLLRDSQAAGVRYGIFDLNWMIHSLSLQLDGTGRQRLVVDARRGLSVLKQFLRARSLMYEQVYLHRTVRGADRLLRAMFERAADPAKPTDYSDEKNRKAPPVFRTVLSAEKPAKPSLQDFLLTDDIAVVTLIKFWSNSSRDPVLRYLATCFLRRRLFKEVGSWLDQAPKEFVNAARGAVAKGFAAQQVDIQLKEKDIEDAMDYFLLIDTAESKSDETLEGILFDVGDGALYTLEELNQKPEFVTPVAVPPFRRVRLFVPYDVRKTVEDTLGRNKEMEH